MSDYAVQIRDLTKSFKILKTFEHGTSSNLAVNFFLSLFLGKTFNPLVKRREVVEVKALDNVSLDVNHGEILGLFGKNGSGKTTLLSILGTIIPPDQGRICIFGYDYINSIEEIRGFIIPMFGWLRDVDNRLTARQNIERGLLLMKMLPSDHRKSIEEAAAFFELDERIDDRVERFSSGMAIKVALMQLPRASQLVLPEQFL